MTGPDQALSAGLRPPPPSRLNADFPRVRQIADTRVVEIFRQPPGRSWDGISWPAVPADDDWLSRGVGGFLWGHVERFVLRRRGDSDARLAKGIAAGAHLGRDGLPVGTIPAEFIDSRPEANLVYPHARELYRTSERGTGSMLARVLAFDAPLAAEMNAGYVASATPTEVLNWYAAELQARGWSSGTHCPVGGLDTAAQGFSRTGNREHLRVRVPSDISGQAILERHGAPPLRHGQVLFSVTYTILVRYEDERPRAVT